MGGLMQVSPPAEKQTVSRSIFIGVVVFLAVAGGIALMLRSERKVPAAPPAYVANLKLTDLKLSAAENFVGASVIYLDGSVTNTGEQNVIHAVVRVVFKDGLGQTAQKEEVGLRVLQTGGPYPDAVDLSASPLGPGQTKPFRLTFEGISQQWNRAYPEIVFVDVKLK